DRVRTRHNGLRRIVVIGGGITGLAAAHRLVERSRSTQPNCDRLLLEAGPRLGGLISTMRRDGFIVESGPDAFITNKPWALDLICDLGLSERLIGTNPEWRRTFVVRGGALHPLPEGFFLLAPTRIRPFLRSRLLSWRGKVRVLLDLLLPRGRSDADESLASFVRRRLGQEALARLAQPMVGGIYTADPERLSLRAIFPQFLEMEARHGSVIRALRREQMAASPGHQAVGGARYGLFATLDDGLQILVDALAERLPAGAVRLSTPVAAIAREGARWAVRLEDGAVVGADGVVLTTPAYQAARLLRDLDPEIARELEAIPYASSLTVTLAYRRDDVAHPLDGFGFVIPSCEGRSVIACSFSSVKFPNRAPANHVLLRAFAGGALQPEVLEWDDRTLLSAVLRDLGELLGIRSAPLWSQVARHARSMPQYHVGHLRRVEAIERHLNRWPTLRLAGNAYRGIGIPDSIRSGEAAANSLLTELGGTRAAGLAQAVT
ncbi:MAG: protoporphyrinogen oxidase, partial [Candidatus Methylomirabilaceae bacterium]